jgi:exonuclease SbcC
MQQLESDAQATHTARSEAKARQESLLSSLAKRAVLEAQADQIAQDELRLDTAERAEKVRAVLDARDSATATHAVAEQATVKARDVWAAVTDRSANATPTATPTADNPPTSAVLSAQVKALEKTLAELSLAANAESAVTEGETEIATLSATLATLTAESNALTEQSLSLPAAITAAETVVREIALHEVQLGAVTAEADVAKKRLAAARSLSKLQEKHQGLLAAEALRTAESAQASKELATLIERQLDGYAATLASTLDDGEPCLVCGATTHPLLATIGDHDPVTADDVEEARAAESTARTAQDDARAACVAVATEMATQAAVADGLGSDEAQGAVDASEARLQEITTALANKDSANDTVQSLTTSLATLTASMEANRLSIASTSTATATAQQSLATATLARDAARAEFATVSARIANVEDQRDGADHYLEALLAVEAAEAILASSRTSLAEALTRHGFAAEGECTVALVPATTLHELRTATANHRAELKSHNDIISAAAADGITETPIDISEAQAALLEAKERVVASQGLSVLAKQRRESLATLVDAARTDEAENAELLSRFATVNTLSRLTAGDDPNTFKMRLESFVLAAKLEEIVEAANKRLSSMTQERYALEYDDELAGNAKSGLGISVLDNFTGQSRSAKSLSGGETFLASLALALGLAEVVSSQAGGIRLDTLFIDEGFGALDSGTLAIAMNTIHELRAGGRTIGLISHVEEMKQQIPNKLHVVKTKDGSSSIKTEA